MLDLFQADCMQKLLKNELKFLIKLSFTDNFVRIPSKIEKVKMEFQNFYFSNTSNINQNL